MKNVLITAGATVIRIDQVRAITNIFKGKTGTAIAHYFADMGINTTLVTSNPSIAKEHTLLKVIRYSTYGDLAEVLEREIKSGLYDVVIHSAAVSDYQVAGVYFKDEKGTLVPLDVDTKISSAYPNLYLELAPTKKLIDLIRDPWGFNGSLIKFKLEVGKSKDELLEIASRSVNFSKADLIVANCLEWFGQTALLVKPDGCYEEVNREELAKKLYRRVI